MNKKGFTLIELLAVIVILAVIALIATPMIMGVINEARRGSLERTYENIEHTAELYFFDKYEGKLNTDPTVIPMSELKSMVKNYTSDMESESVIVSKKVNDIAFYYTGRDNNPYEVQGKLKELIEKDTNHIKMNVVVNGKTVNKVYGTKSEKDSIMKNYVWYSGNDLNIAYWYINRSAGSSSLVQLMTGSGFTAGSYAGQDWNAVRPVMVLNSNVVITEGNGTMNNPYSISN